MNRIAPPTLANPWGMAVALRRRARLAFAHLTGQLAFRLLVTASKAFARAGDTHEFDHCRAAIAAGACQGETCSRSVLDSLADALEAIAHYAPGHAGVIATETLIDAGIWSATVETAPRAHPLEHWLQDGCAHVPCHDHPAPHTLTQALVSGARVIVAAEPASPAANATRRRERTAA